VTHRLLACKYNVQRYREAVKQLSPGLPRFVATLGTKVMNGVNPEGVVDNLSLNGLNPINKESFRFGNDPTFPPRSKLWLKDTTPLGLQSVGSPSQGSREARQPWAELLNRFAVMPINVRLGLRWNGYLSFMAS
jgi:hypothetical protein